MLLRRKVDRAMKWSRDRSLQAEGIDPEEEELKAELRKHSSKKEEIPSREELMAERGDSGALYPQSATAGMNPGPRTCGCVV